MDIMDQLGELAQQATLVVIVAYTLYWVGVGTLQAASKLCRGRKLRDWLFEPVDVRRLGKATVNFFDDATTRMEGLGFERLTDVRLSRIPEPFYARFFLAGDGSSFGAVSDCGGRRTYDFFSVFDDGTYLETTAMTLVYDVPAGEQFEVHNHPDAQVDELYETHQEHVRACERRRGCSVVEVTPEDLDAVANYGRHVLRNGRKWRPRMIAPPPCVTGKPAATSAF